MGNPYLSTDTSNYSSVGLANLYTMYLYINLVSILYDVHALMVHILKL